MTINPNKGENKRQVAARETKKKIKETALSLFEEHGFDVVTIEDITKSAGVSKGTFYVYYVSKDQILVDQFKKIDKHYKKTYENMPRDISSMERIRIISEAVFDFCANNLGLNIIRVMYNNQISVSGSANDQKFLNDHKRVLYKILLEMVEMGVAENEIRPGVDAATVVNALNSCYHGVLYDWCLYNGKFDRVETGKLYVDFLISGFTSTA
jgi:AcrR family transcriptional regulator